MERSILLKPARQTPGCQSLGRQTLGCQSLGCRLVAALIFVAAMSSAASAQGLPGQPSAKKKSGSVSGSPLDTLMHTHLHTQVPPAPDWIAETRPDPKTLDYTPLTGNDPVRPKPRDAANVLALQAELEKDALVNNAKADGLRPSSHPARHRRKAAN